jgi:hypothetical protein
MQLLDTIKTNLARVFLLYFKLNKTAQKNIFNNFYKNANSLLIVFPSAKENVQEAVSILKKVAEDKKNITTLIDKKYEEEISQVKNLTILSYGDKDKNFLGLPNSLYRSKLTGKKYDLVIDLNLKPDYYSLDCINSANPALRVGFYENQESKLFNIQIKNSSKESKISYKNLLNCLTMF